MRALGSPSARSLNVYSVWRRSRAKCFWLLLLVAVLAIVSLSNLTLRDIVSGHSTRPVQQESSRKVLTSPGVPNLSPLERLDQAVRSLRENPTRQNLRTAKAAERTGILIPAGGPVFLANAAALVQVLREHHQCAAPVEVAFWGQDEAVEKLLSRIEGFGGVQRVDLDRTALPNGYDPASFRGFGSKILALYASSFRTVLMLDADNLPLIDPTRLLEHSSLALHGNLFWPDLFQREGLGIVSPEAYSLFQLSPPWTTDPDFHHTESGQFVIDRIQHQDVLEWLLLLQAQFDAILHRYMHGDKDLYRLAFALAGKSNEFCQVKVNPRLLLHDPNPFEAYLQLAMVQSLDDGTLASLHRTTPGAKKGTAAEPNPIRLNWPDLITAPINGREASNLLDWNGERGMCIVWKHRLASTPSQFCNTQPAPASSSGRQDAKQTWCSPSTDEPVADQLSMRGIANMPLTDQDAFNDVLGVLQAAYDEVLAIPLHT